MFYVGETEGITRRLRQHRSRFLRENGIRIGCIVIRVENKSVAREIETKIISKLRREGYLLQSVSDGKHVLFGSSSSF
jgi:hypothetical protein